MVMNCVAYKCNNLHDKRNKISFHSFPFKNPEILDLWIKAIRREKDWKPSKSSKLCSDHFLPHDYKQIPTGSTLKLLKEDAVPSVFIHHPAYLQSCPNKQGRALEHCHSSDSSSNEKHETSAKHNIEYVDAQTCDFSDSSSNVKCETSAEDNIEYVDAQTYHFSDSSSNVKHETFAERNIEYVDAQTWYFSDSSSNVKRETSAGHDIKYVNAQTQTSPINTLKCGRHSETEKNLHRKVKTLQQKVRRLNSRVSTMSDVIKVLESRSFSTFKLNSFGKRC